MKELEDRIREQGIVRAGNVLKVDSFLNHQCDPQLFASMAEEWKKRFAGKQIDKVLTIEASGIGIAAIVAEKLGVPFVFAKKTESINLDGEQYRAQVFSFTKKKTYDVIVAKRFINEGEHVLLIDDFLASGKAILGLLDLCKQAGAVVEGIGIAIEKSFQDGGELLRSRGYDVQSLARITTMDDQTGEVKFVED